MVGAVLGFSDDSPKAVAAGALSFAGSFVFASAKVLLPVAASACVLLDCVALDFLALSLSNGFSLEIEGEGGVNVLALGAVDAGRAALSSHHHCHCHHYHHRLMVWLGLLHCD